MPEALDGTAELRPDPKESLEKSDLEQVLFEAQAADHRTALHSVRGVLVYLELPSSASAVHERNCKWPHEVDSNRAHAIRRHTTHSISSARTYSDISLRSCGFQLFGGDVPMPPTPAQIGDKGAMMEYIRNVEAFVLTKLQHGTNFRLAPGEHVHSTAAYNHVVRCSGERGGERGQPQPVAGDHVISEVHSDFTQASGPAVLRHVLCDGTPRTYGGAAGRAMAGLGGLPPRRGTRADVKASPSAGAILADAPAGKRKSWRYLFVNVWQSMDRDHPVREWPLALLHPRSWSLEGGAHVVKVKTHKIFPENYTLRSIPATSDNYTLRSIPATSATAAAAASLSAAPGAAATAPERSQLREDEHEDEQSSQVKSSDLQHGHEWVYYPGMTADEALVFVNFDSDETQPQFVVHGAANLEADVEAEAAEPTTFLEDAEEKVVPCHRISVEVRILVLIQREAS